MTGRDAADAVAASFAVAAAAAAEKVAEKVAAAAAAEAKKQEDDAAEEEEDQLDYEGFDDQEEDPHSQDPRAGAEANGRDDAAPASARGGADAAKGGAGAADDGDAWFNQVGPGRHCSPRHRTPFNSPFDSQGRNEGSK